MRVCKDQVGQWPCLVRTVTIELMDLRQPCLSWATLFSGLGILGILSTEKHWAWVGTYTFILFVLGWNITSCFSSCLHLSHIDGQQAGIMSQNKPFLLRWLISFLVGVYYYSNRNETRTALSMGQREGKSYFCISNQVFSI